MGANARQLDFSGGKILAPKVCLKICQSKGRRAQKSRTPRVTFPPFYSRVVESPAPASKVLSYSGLFAISRFRYGSTLTSRTIRDFGRSTPILSELRHCHRCESLLPPMKIILARKLWLRSASEGLRRSRNPTVISSANFTRRIRVRCNPPRALISLCFR